ncbi:MAG: RES family NAD+ phosphorylase [Ferruginibacter sp.]
MIVYRLAIEPFKEDLSGTGSKLYGGRWNVPGVAAIYTAENISLAVLEILVNADKNNIPPAYYLLKLNVPDNLPVKVITTAGLKEKWYSDFEYAQYIGSRFLESGKEAILKVPSAIIREEYNFLLNPDHTDFKKISIKESIPFDLDIRLVKK